MTKRNKKDSTRCKNQQQKGGSESETPPLSLGLDERWACQCEIAPPTMHFFPPQLFRACVLCNVCTYCLSSCLFCSLLFFMPLEGGYYHPKTCVQCYFCLNLLTVHVQPGFINPFPLPSLRSSIPPSTFWLPPPLLTADCHSYQIHTPFPGGGADRVVPSSPINRITFSRLLSYLILAHLPLGTGLRSMTLSLQGPVRLVCPPVDLARLDSLRDLGFNPTRSRSISPLQVPEIYDYRG